MCKTDNNWRDSCDRSNPQLDIPTRSLNILADHVTRIIFFVTNRYRFTFSVCDHSVFSIWRLVSVMLNAHIRQHRISHRVIRHPIKWVNSIKTSESENKTLLQPQNYLRKSIALVISTEVSKFSTHSQSNVCLKLRNTEPIWKKQVSRLCEYFDERQSRFGSLSVFIIA